MPKLFTLKKSISLDLHTKVVYYIPQLFPLKNNFTTYQRRGRFLFVFIHQFQHHIDHISMVSSLYWLFWITNQ